MEKVKAISLIFKIKAFPKLSTSEGGNQMTDDELKALVASLAEAQKITNEKINLIDEKLQRLGIIDGGH
jgi:hypothetical protein